MEVHFHYACFVALIIHVCAVRAIAHLHLGHEHTVTVFLILEFKAGSCIEKNILIAEIFYADVDSCLCQIGVFLQIIYAIVLKHFKTEMRFKNNIVSETLLIKCNKVNLVIYLIEKTSYLFHCFGSKIIIAVQKEKIFSLGVLYSEISRCGKSLVLF